MIQVLKVEQKQTVAHFPEKISQLPVAFGKLKTEALHWDMVMHYRLTSTRTRKSELSCGGTEVEDPVARVAWLSALPRNT